MQLRSFMSDYLYVFLEGRKVYRTYNLDLSDSGYFFKKNEVDEPRYLWFNYQKVFPSNENYAKSVIVFQSFIILTIS
jgi:hypothetical protein